MPRRRTVEIYIDGACSGNPGPAGVGIVLIEDAAKPGRGISKYIGEATNNVAEYLALVYALQEAMQRGYRAVSVKTDSELLVRQVEGAYKVRNGQLRLFHDLVQHLAGGFAPFHLTHVPRTKNRLADRLATRAVAARRGSTVESLAIDN